MTREQKLCEAERLLGLFVESPEVDGCDPCERCCEYVTRARGLLRAALSTPADAPCSTCGDGLFTGSTTLGTLRPCPDCVPADAPATAEQEVCIACGKPWPCEHAAVRTHLVAAPPPRPDEDGECQIHGEKWIEGTDCPQCGGKRVWHGGMGSTTTDEHQRCLGPCGMDRYVDGIDA